MATPWILDGSTYERLEKAKALGVEINAIAPSGRISNKRTTIPKATLRFAVGLNAYWAFSPFARVGDFS